MSSPPSNAKQAAGSTELTNYLKAFQQLGPRIFLYTPAQHNGGHALRSSSPGSEAQPNLIIICSWMAALPRHIAKYTDSYVAQFPHIPVLLVRSSQKDLMLKKESTQIGNMSPAVSAIKSVLANAKTESRVLMHIFSNGGSWTADLLARAYSQSTAGQLLPVTALVLDSCPSLPHTRLGHLALTAALPKNFIIRFFGSAVIWIFVFIIRLLDELGITKNFIMKVRAALNDPAGPYVNKGIPRAYICSKTDAMVPIEDVRLHAQEAKEVMKQGGVVEEEVERKVVVEEFKNSTHVGHLMVDKERYWKVVHTVWNLGMKEQNLRRQSMKQ